jgi:hypothetical protein
MATSPKNSLPIRVREGDTRLACKRQSDGTASVPLLARRPPMVSSSRRCLSWPGVFLFSYRPFLSWRLGQSGQCAVPSWGNREWIRPWWAVLAPLVIRLIVGPASAEILSCRFLGGIDRWWSLSCTFDLKLPKSLVLLGSVCDLLGIGEEMVFCY